MDSNNCFQNNQPMINSVHRRRKNLARRREQILTCGDKANSQLAFWEKSYVSWAQHLQNFKLFQGKPSLYAHTNPFFTQTHKNAVIMLLSGKCGAATVVSTKTLIPCDTSAAYSLSLCSYTSESNSLNHTVIGTVCELFLCNESHSRAVVRMGNGRTPLHSHKGKSSYI